MTTVWIASMVLQWLVIAALCVLVLSIVRQLGALNLRLNGLRDAQAEEGPALHSRLPPHELTLVDGTPRSVGGPSGRPTLVVFFSPSCGACEALPDAIAKIGAEQAARRDQCCDDNGDGDHVATGGTPELDLVAVISADRAGAARLAAEKSLDSVSVAASEDFPEHYIPRHGVPFAIALTAGGVVAARGKPKTLAHLREMAHAASHMAELATTHAARDHEWGQSAPYWDATQHR
jgi:thiol-disulfide isomerase/thioredoxin